MNVTDFLLPNTPWACVHSMSDKVFKQGSIYHTINRSFTSSMGSYYTVSIGIDKGHVQITVPLMEGTLYNFLPLDILADKDKFIFKMTGNMDRQLYVEYRQKFNDAWVEAYCGQ